MHEGGKMQIIFCIVNSYQDGISTLYFASWKGHITIVQTLLAAGAEMNTATFNVC